MFCARMFLRNNNVLKKSLTLFSNSGNDDQIIVKNIAVLNSVRRLNGDYPFIPFSGNLFCPFILPSMFTYVYKNTCVSGWI